MLRRKQLAQKVKALREMRRKAERKAKKQQRPAQPSIPNSKKIHLKLEDAIAKKAKLEE